MVVSFQQKLLSGCPFAFASLGGLLKVKKVLIVVLCIVLVCGVFVGCGAGGDAVGGEWRFSDEYIEAETNAYIEAFGTEPDAEIIDSLKSTTITFDGKGGFVGTGQMEGSGSYESDGDAITVDGVLFSLKDGGLYMDGSPYGDIPVWVKA